MTLSLTYGCCYRARIGRRDEHFCASVRRVNSLFCEYHHGHQPPLSQWVPLTEWPTLDLYRVLAFVESEIAAREPSPARPATRLAPSVPGAASGHPYCYGPLKTFGALPANARPCAASGAPVIAQSPETQAGAGSPVPASFCGGGV